MKYVVYALTRKGAIRLGEAKGSDSAQKMRDAGRRLWREVVVYDGSGPLADAEFERRANGEPSFLM